MYLYVTLGWYDLVVYSNGRRAGDIVGRTDVKGNHTFIKKHILFFQSTFAETSSGILFT